MHKVLPNHTLHQIQFPTVARLHATEIRHFQTDVDISGITAISQCAGIQMFDRYRHSVATPSEIARLKHQSAASQIYAVGAESAQFVGVYGSGGIDTKTGLIVNLQRRCIGGVRTATQGNLCRTSCTAVDQVQIERQLGGAIPICIVRQCGDVESILYGRPRCLAMR